MVKDNSFEYGGKHFEPVRKFNAKDGDFHKISRNLRTDKELGFFEANYHNSQKYAYNYEDFYKAYGNKDCDIFTRSQSLYKLGRSYEQINDIENDQNALFAYCDLIYRALNNENIPALWINKSAKNAINIHLRHGGSNSLREAMQIVDNLRILKILSQAELNSLTEDIKKHYK